LADVRKGDPVIYRSFGGPVYPAVVAAVYPAGFYDIDVDIGAKEPWRLTGIRAERIQPKENA
jgi:hypothetical protein